MLSFISIYQTQTQQRRCSQMADGGENRHSHIKGLPEVTTIQHNNPTQQPNSNVRSVVNLDYRMRCRVKQMVSALVKVFQ